jgi:hypothetical protein
MSIAMEYRGPALAAAVGDWRATFFAGQAFIANPGGTDWAVSVVDGVAYDGTETLVTLRSAVLTEAFTAAQVGRNPAGDVQAHAARHRAGGLDPLAHADLAGVAAGTMTHAQIDAYLAGLSEVVSDVDADLAAEVTARQIWQSAVEQTLLEQEADLSETRSALETAVSLRALAARVISTSFPIQGGGSLEADRTLTLALAVVSDLLGYGVTLSGKVVTDEILKAVTKLLISSNTTIYVATTGSDTTGTGLAGAPFASIHKALASIAGMLIATGVIVTIQVADGVYTVTSAITIDHPDGDKIQILGNTSAETTVAIASIDTTAKTITVAGNYTASVAVGDMIGWTGDVRTITISSISGNVFTVSTDPTGKLAIGDTIYILNGSTSANIKSYVVTGFTSTTVTVSATIPSTTVGGASLTVTNQGAYLVSAVAYTGGSTVITCSDETIASATVGGGSVKIMPCNRCRLQIAGSISCFYATAKLKLLNGFRIDYVSGSSTVGVNATTCDIAVGGQMIFKGLSVGMQAYRGASIFAATGFVCYSCTTGVNILYRSTFAANGAGLTIFNGCTTGCIANQGSYGYLYSTIVGYRGNTVNTSPALNTSGNYDSFIGG